MSVYVAYFIQILLVIHVIRTGRSRYWIWLLLFLPLVGGAAYLILEIMPALGTTITGQRALRAARAALNPGATLRHSRAAWEQSPNADNARRYVSELLAAGRHEEAGDVLDQALSGFFRTEPNLMLLRAELEFATARPERAVEVLESLHQSNPDFRSAQGHLLYARALESAGQVDKAVNEFRAVSGYFPGAEARCRLALALQGAGRLDESRQEFEQLIQDARLAPAHFRRAQARWIRLAKSHLRKAGQALANRADSD